MSSGGKWTRARSRRPDGWGPSRPCGSRSATELPGAVGLYTPYVALATRFTAVLVDSVRRRTFAKSSLVVLISFRFLTFASFAIS